MTSIWNKIPRFARTVFVLAFWIFIWWIISVCVNQEVLVPSPAEVSRRLLELIQTKEFYTTVLNSVLRIISGFLYATVAGVLLGILAARISLLDELISPLLSLVKATPVASFIILALVWIDKQLIPSFISFLMVFPIIHGNVSTGLKNTPYELIEMAKIYHFSFRHKITKLYFPAVFPYFAAGFKTALGLSWKAGVAAEVLCFPKNSIGKELYEAKTYLETIDVFAWTVTIVVISVLIEKVLMWLVEKIQKNRKERKCV